MVLLQEMSTSLRGLHSHVAAQDGQGASPIRTFGCLAHALLMFVVHLGNCVVQPGLEHLIFLPPPLKPPSPYSDGRRALCLYEVKFQVGVTAHVSEVKKKKKIPMFAAVHTGMLALRRLRQGDGESQKARA